MDPKEKARNARKVSRGIFGSVGKGRKTKFTDKKKQADKDKCRDKSDE